METIAPRTYATRSYATPGLISWLALGALAGAASVLIFHQGAVALLNAFDATDRVAWSLQPTEPYGVPQLGSLAFWGAVWGVAFAALLRSLDDGRVVAASLVLGMLLPTLVAWFLVAPLKGLPMAAGFEPLPMAVGLIANGAWGLGTGLGLVWLSGKRRIERRHAAAAERRRLDRRHAERRHAGGRRAELRPHAA